MYDIHNISLTSLINISLFPEMKVRDIIQGFEKDNINILGSGDLLYNRRF